MLREIAEGLWVAEAPLRVLGLELGCRMTVVRLPDGGLLLCSPIPMAGGLREALEGLGPVRAIVFPNRMHHLSGREAIEAFPEAATWGPAGLAGKRPDLRLDHATEQAPPPAWDGALGAEFVRGTRLDEVALLHPTSRTLVLTDLAFRLRPGQGGAWMRLYLRMNGARGELTVMRLARMAIRDRAAVRASVDRILEWPFERVIVAHGEICESGGREELRRAFTFL